MRKVVAAIAAASLTVALAAPGAGAAPTAVNVRIEGKSETLFEGPVLAEPHGVRAASDSIAPKIRRCDGTNPSNPAGVGSPTSTPTAVTADGMSLVGESFDGKWYDDLEDYFLTRWGPDVQNVGAAAYWGLLVNDVFTAVGGCQYPLDAGDEVLWIYDAFKGRPTLALFPETPHYDAGPRPLTATATLNQPFPVEVVSYADDLENKPPAAPTRQGSSGFLGAKVAPVITGAKGFQRVDTASGATVTTDAAGKASVTFATPGWHRIKATVGSAGAESAIRSNRLDVCVPGGGGTPLEGAVDCGELPAADQARTPAPTLGEIEGPRRKPAAGAQPGGSQDKPSPSAAVAGSIRVTTPRLNRGQIGRGRLDVSWQVLDPGPGIEVWLISSRTLGRKGAPYVTRASGAGGTSATVRLPHGHSYRLRFTITDLLGRGSTIELGKVTVPGARHR